MGFGAYLWLPRRSERWSVDLLNVSHHATTQLGYATLELTIANQQLPAPANEYVGHCIEAEVWQERKPGLRGLVLSRSLWQLDRVVAQATMDPVNPNVIMSLVGVNAAAARRINAMWDQIGDTERPPPMPPLPKFSTIAEADAWMAKHEASARAARDHTLRGSS